MAHCTSSPPRRRSLAADIAIGLVGGATILLQHGCLALYGHRTVTAQVVDGDTAAPLAGATVEVRNNASYLTLNAPDAVVATTDENGIVSLRIPEVFPVLWNISKPGYERQVHHVAHEVVPAEFVPDEWHRVRIPLFAPPPPEIVVVLPDGFRGPVAVTIGLTPTGLASLPGTRTLELVSPPDGIVVAAVAGPFNLVDSMNPRIRMRLSSGAPVATASTESFPEQVRQRRVSMLFTKEATKILYVVGDSAEAAEVASEVEPTTMRDGRSSKRFDQAAFSQYFGEPAPAHVE